ncbi:FAD-binding oxidoreductase [Solirubrobacter sp. CPCC 204708]|uniref:FAD-binding oxidoreductase n=1 Tax=Solirubrobacter deserti TaxID=2282478 RepID=A0ABT4RSI5_9ACTN|nr:FAD-binding oxidoreductase [Solirubrobacter deserti]MBE2315135.1 FAD-binding oxidoreductase [Solirubrobacter deserti]MDA0141343.1 FAD-binding oxidoreductase [Solirubrobacter deserti]
MRREQVFWGWGEPGAGPSLPEHARDVLRQELGVSGDVVSRPVESVSLPAPSLPNGLRERLEAVAEVRDDDLSRVLRTRGKSYLDLLASRSGDFASAPDAVVAPGDAAAVAEVLRVCGEYGVAVVPFGGGTSVVGGLAGERGPFSSLVSLDLGRLDRVVSVDPRSLVAVFEPGTRLPEADAALRAHGLALGHVPQSYEWATVGGCAATRSAGQTSTGHGRIDEQVVALSCVTPSGSLATLDAPASAAGPSLRELVLGSEGTLGVITSVALRVRRRGEVSFDGWSVESFLAGAELLRALEQDGIAPDIARLSDEQETRTSLALAGTGTVGRRLLGGRCLLVCGWQGATGRASAARKLIRGGALPLGPSPGHAWEKSRFAGPHLRDDLLDRGVLVETLETATTWSNLERLYRAVPAALPGLHVGCHVSHVYATGASLYFTVLGAQSEDPVGQWRAFKDAASRAIVANGGTITHHHAVGRDHAPYLGDEIGELGMELLRTVKTRCDPAGIMNPGKLITA